LRSLQTKTSMIFSSGSSIGRILGAVLLDRVGDRRHQLPVCLQRRVEGDGIVGGGFLEITGGADQRCAPSVVEAFEQIRIALQVLHQPLVNSAERLLVTLQCPDVAGSPAAQQLDFVAHQAGQAFRNTDLLREGCIRERVAGPVEADNEAVTDKHVVAHAFELDDILDPHLR